MKPDWTKAPEWAQWWACDKSGVSYWYKNKPQLLDNHLLWWAAISRIIVDSLHTNHPDWRNSLEKRPE